MIQNSLPFAPPHGLGGFGHHSDASRSGGEMQNRAGRSSLVDFDRQGVPWDKWRHTEANAGGDYPLCASYPSLGLVVPCSVVDDDLRAAAGFRAHRRFPVLSYYHNSTGASLTRASQPLVGVIGGRNAKDENLLRAVYDNNTVRE
eukprot:SAG31_NODE_901_length_11133_cov_9.476799_3_plen_145_part_00